MNRITGRLYTLLFAILPHRLQLRLWNYLADKHGYFGIQKFGNRCIQVSGTRLIKEPLIMAKKRND